MERRFRIRLNELLDDAEVPPGLLRGALPRLEAFVQPFVASLQRGQQDLHARRYVAGLLSTLPDKNVASIAFWLCERSCAGHMWPRSKPPPS